MRLRKLPMLNLDVNVDVNVKQVRVPFTFKDKNQCTACGGENTLVVVDIFGREAKGIDLHPFDYIRCKKCGFNYSIRWDSTDDGKMKPVAINRSLNDEFKNLLNYKNIKENGTTEI